MSTSRQSWLSATVIAALMVHTGVMAHNLVAHHARCAEHGEWVEANNSELRAPLAEAASLRLPSPPSEHTHCTMAAEQRRAILRAPERVALRTLPPTALPQGRPAPSSGAAVPPIKVAPKQSPPLA